VRLLCADTHPDHDTLCTFRRQNAVLLGACFAQVLELAAGCGVLKVGGITVAIDGTKILANASKHSAASYEHAGQTMRQLDLEIAQLLRKAEEAAGPQSAVGQSARRDGGPRLRALSSGASGTCRPNGRPGGERSRWEEAAGPTARAAQSDPRSEGAI